jgi:bacillopeptidase F
VKGDGLDQDCNGYDLTIQVTKATFTPRSGMLRVEATRALNGAAALGLSGLGPMTWSAIDLK